MLMCRHDQLRCVCALGYLVGVCNTCIHVCMWLEQLYAEQSLEGYTVYIYICMYVAKKVECV